MSLMDLLQSNDPAIQNGLLNFGLSLMRSKGNFGNAVGQAGVAGQLGARDFRQQQALMSRTSLNDELLKNQLEQQQRMMALQKLPQQFLKPPSAPAVDATGGMDTAQENPANASGPGGFDMGGYINALAGMDPVQALQLRQSLQKQAPAPIKLGEGDQLLDPTTYKPVASNPKAAKPADLPNAVQEYQFAQSQGYKGTFNDWVTAKARAGAANVTANSYGAPVAGIGPDGKPAFFQADKTGRASIVPGVSPAPSAAQERAEQEKAQKGRQSQQMLSVLEDAEKILTRGSPTASGVGTVADAAARAVGVTTTGAQDAARLQSLSGWLVANVPRMEGPQSNFDVQNYMTMAGKVGDSTVPKQERVAALREVRKLQRKYAEINGTPMQSEPAASSAVNWSDLK